MTLAATCLLACPFVTPDVLPLLISIYTFAMSLELHVTFLPVSSLKQILNKKLWTSYAYFTRPLLLLRRSNGCFLGPGVTSGRDSLQMRDMNNQRASMVLNTTPSKATLVPSRDSASMPR